MKKNKLFEELINCSLQKALLSLRFVVILMISGILQAGAKDVIIDNKIIFAPDNMTKEQQTQKRSITGTVTGKDGTPIPMVNVVVTGTTQGTLTDVAGKYSIEVSPGSKSLSFTYIGLEPQEIVIGALTKIDVTMSESAIDLDEVVIIGYGSQKKKDIIGSVATINNQDMQVKVSSSFETSLQGLAAGVSIQTQSGVPGAPTKILIRGTSSINSSTDPLWIVDGIPIISYDATQNMGTTSQSPMSLINQSDIESIQVLKDAAATAIYGSRASNGVILITTRSGKAGKGTTSVDYSVGISDLSRKPSDIGFANTTQWFNAVDRLYINADRTFTMEDYYAANRNAFTKVTREQVQDINTDWYGKIFRKGTFQDFNFSSSKGLDKTLYFVSVNYRKDNGVQISNSLQRFSGRANIDFHPFDLLTIGLKMNLSYTNNDRQQNNGFVNTGVGGANGGLNAVTGAALPWYPVYDFDNPNQYFNPYSGANPMAYADPNNLKDNLNQYRGLGSFYADFKVPHVKGLSLRSEFSFDYLQSNSIYWTGPAITLDPVVYQKPNTYASDQAITNKTINYNAYATYDRTFGAHNILILGGAEATRSNGYYRYASGRNLIGTYQQLGSPGTIISSSAGLGGERYLGAFFGRANYKFKDRYLLGLSVRRDGTSAFAKEYRWGTFLAYSAGWILTDEPFMDFLGEETFIKIRGSYGETGNQNIPSGLNLALYSGEFVYGGANILGVNGTLPYNVPVGDLTWETTKSTDAGIDFGFLNNRINGSIAYYNKYVQGMLLTGPVPFSAGIGGSNYIWGNVGDMTNSGVELEVHSTNLIKGDFKWTTDFNISHNKNIIKQLTPEADQTGKGLFNDDGSGHAYTVSRKGQKRMQWYLANFAGIDPANGVPMIVALDSAEYAATGNTRALKNINGTDSLILGTITNINQNKFIQEGKSADPAYYGGITNTFQYKGLEFSFLVTFSGGNYIYDYSLQNASAVGPQKQFLSDVLDNSWQRPGDIAKYPQLRIGGYEIDGKINSDFAQYQTYYTQWLYKGDFIRLKNVRLSYSLPSSVTKKMNMQNVTFSVSGTNLWTITDYPGFDPEGAEFVRTAFIPQLKSLIFGLSVKF